MFWASRLLYLFIVLQIVTLVYSQNSTTSSSSSNLDIHSSSNKDITILDKYVLIGFICTGIVVIIILYQGFMKFIYFCAESSLNLPQQKVLPNFDIPVGQQLGSATVIIPPIQSSTTNLNVSAEAAAILSSAGNFKRERSRTWAAKENQDIENDNVTAVKPPKPPLPTSSPPPPIAATKNRRSHTNV